MSAKRSITQISKDELVDRLNFRCSHRHNGVDHWDCYDQQNGGPERVGFLDIESTNLKASFGIVLTYCIKADGGEIIENSVRPTELRRKVYDKRLMSDFCSHVRKFDRLITWYGNKFDIPFLRTRCLLYGLPFPLYKECLHTDAYLVARHKLKLHSNRLGAVSEFFGIPAKEHPLNPEMWLGCLSGDKKAIDFVLTHNREDVVSLEAVWGRIQAHSRLAKTSI